MYNDSLTVSEQPSAVLTKPSAEDGKEVWKLIRDAQTLDLNSAYSYIMLCDYFADTCVVARSAAGEVIGFVSAYIPSHKPDTLFVWQIAVAESFRGRGLGSQLLTEALGRKSCGQVRFVEATVSPSNTASRSLFQRMADRLNTTISESEGYASGMFPEGAHEDEKLLRVGPFEH